MKVIQVYLKEESHTNVVRLADEKMVSKAALVRLAIAEYLKRHMAKVKEGDVR